MHEFMLFLHLLGVLVLVGGVGVNNWAGFSMAKATDASDIARLARLACRTEHRVIIPAAVVLLLAGLDLVRQSSIHGYDSGWVIAAIALWFVALGLGHFLSAGAKRLAVLADAESGPASEELRTRAGLPIYAIAGNLLNVILLVFLYLMIWKPGA